MASIMTLSASAAVRPVARARSSAIRASAAPAGVKASTSSSVPPSKLALGRRDAVLAVGASALQLLAASKAWALIPGNDDEDEE
jgi:hypothetical protein